MNKRLELLEKMAAAGNADAFTLYALAMEYRREGRGADAIAVFEKLRAKDPDYVPTYLMAGQVLVEDGNPEAARAWFEAGIVAATKKGDAKARNELEAALADCE